MAFLYKSKRYWTKTHFFINVQNIVVFSSYEYCLFTMDSAAQLSAGDIEINGEYNKTVN